jgi:hypothetical protein
VANPREAREHLRPLQPVLVKLRRQFDEIARHIGSPQQREGDIGEQPVQRVTEFVEERLRIVE